MKILVLQLKRIGDLILTTPALRCLREEFPKARITLATDSSCRGLLGAIPVDEHWIYDKSSGWGAFFGRGPNAWVRAGLPAFSGDWCLDFTGTDRSAWLTFSSGCQRKVTFARFQKKFLRKFAYTDFVESSVRMRHTADHCTDLLKPLGITRENVPLDLHLPEAAVAEAAALRANAGVTGPYAVIHAGTARPEKYWLPDRWAEIARFLLAEYGLPSILTGASSPDEKDHLAAIAGAAGNACVDLSGRSDLIGLAAMIQGAKVFCGVDTAAMHLADATGTPCAALFGPTNPFHWRPRHTASVVLRADTAGPFAPGQKGGPMEHLTTSMVIDALRALL